ncbi:MAG: hypothetical protein ACRC2R_20875 [Xenococcaceae cyanobacterium]
MVLSSSFYPIAEDAISEVSSEIKAVREICLGMPYPTVSTFKFWFSGTWCMNILPDGAFSARTVYAQFSRCASLSTTGCFTWLITLTTHLVYNFVVYLASTAERTAEVGEATSPTASS